MGEEYLSRDLPEYIVDSKVVGSPKELHTFEAEDFQEQEEKKLYNVPNLVCSSSSD